MFVSRVNHLVNPAPETFEVQLENCRTRLVCRQEKHSDPLNRVDGLLPEVVVSALKLIKRDNTATVYHLPAGSKNQWNYLSDIVQKFEKLY